MYGGLQKGKRVDSIPQWFGLGIQVITGIVIIVAIILTNKNKYNNHDIELVNLTKAIEKLGNKLDKVIDYQIKHEIRIVRLEDKIVIVQEANK